MDKIKINGIELSLVRVNLKGWARLEELRREMDDAVSKSNIEDTYKTMIDFIETASLSASKIEWDKVFWGEFINLYSQAVSINLPRLKFSILENGKKETEKFPWEYPGRAWFFWLNLFASNYGWDEESIREMDIDTALGLYQEILVDGQFQKEWEWSLSEIAFPYNSSTKKQEYKPLTRPNWMLPESPKELPKVRMRKDMLPVGNIVDVQADEQKRRDDKRGV